MKNENSDKPLDERQIAALKRGILLGKTIQQRLPEVAKDYREGMSLQEIVDKHEIVSVFGLTSTRVAINAVMYALHGYDGQYTPLNVRDYEGLIPETELQSLREIHLKENSKRIGDVYGKRNYERGLGIGRLSQSELSQFGSMGGKIGGVLQGRKNRDLKIGYCGLSDEERAEAGRKSAIIKGQVPYSETELQTLYNLSLLLDYTYHEGSYNPGKPNLPLIAKELNKRFHNCKNIRQPRALTSKLLRIKKKVRKKSDPKAEK